MDTQYRVALDNGMGTRSKGHTLFEACLAARSQAPENLTHAIVVTPEGRLVAFYCGHRNMIAPGFGAHPYEREQIITDFGYQPL